MSAIKKHISTMPLWKKVIWLAVAIGAPIVTAIFTIWSFCLHGTLGLFLWFPVFTYLLIIIIIFAAVGSLLILLDVKKSILESHSKIKNLAWIFCLLSLIISSTTLIYIGGTLAEPQVTTDPQLLMCDGSGKNDIPDMAVTYTTAQPSKDYLKWGEGDLDETIKEKEAGLSHVFVLEDLKPKTDYEYRINGKGDTYKFTTPRNDNNLKFALAGDPHYGRSESAVDVTLELLKQITDDDHENELFFMLGDFVEYGFMRDQWKEGLDAFSPYTTKIPTRPIIGNHDTIFGGVSRYMDYFYPEKMPLDTGSRLWYRIDVGDIHFFMLDLEWGTETYTLEQKEWFEKEIKDVDKDDWTIVMSHCFYFSSGNIDGGRSWSDQPDMIDAFVEIFEENDVDLVFSGHNHHAEILEKKGIYYQIAGTMGAHPDRDAEIESIYSEWYHNLEDDDDFGFFEVEIEDDEAILTFRNRDYDNIKQIVIKQ